MIFSSDSPFSPKPARRVAALRPLVGATLVALGLGQIAPAALAQTAPCLSETEPNETPEQAALLDLPVCATGRLGPGDQDILRVRSSEPGLWQLSLTGIEGNQTRLDLFPTTGEPPQPGVRIFTQIAGEDAPEILLPAGDWLVGLSTAGDATGAWTLSAQSRPLVPGPPSPIQPEEPTISLLQPMAPATFAWTVTPAMARKRWALAVDLPPGASAQMALDGVAGRLLDSMLLSEGPILRRGLGLDAGDYTLTLVPLTAAPVPVRLSLLSDGPRVKAREDEPNDTPLAARALQPGKPVQGSLGQTGDVDLFAIDIDQVQSGRSLTLAAQTVEALGAQARNRAASGQDGAGRSLCLKDATGVDLQCRIGATAELGDLVLAPGRYLAAVSGSMDPGAAYSLALRPGPRPHQDQVAEPNDTPAQAFPLPPDTDLTGRLLGFETDRLALDVTGPPQLWRIESEGAGLMRLEDPQGVQIAQRDSLSGAAVLVLDDILLGNGRHTLMLEGEDQSYRVRASPKGPPPEGAESEPNDDPVHANLLRPGQRRIGRIGDMGDVDHLRFSLRQPATLSLVLTRTDGPAFEAHLRGPGLEEALEVDGATDLGRAFPAGDYTLELRSFSADPAAWQVALDWALPFPPGDLPLSLVLRDPLPAVASHHPLGQSLAATLEVANTGAEPLDLRFEGLSTLPLARIALDPATMTLPPGEGKAVALRLDLPPDLDRDPASLLAIRATDGSGRHASADLRLAVTPEVPPVGARPDVPPPPALRGGFNLASPAFGATIAGETAETLARLTPDNPSILFDGVVGSGGFQGSAGQAIRVNFGPADPVPVAGFALVPQSVLGSFNASPLRDFELALSQDGQNFTPVLRGTLGPVPVETYFPLDQAMPARAAELRLVSGAGPEGAPIDLAEWKVIAEPGQPPGLTLNIADPRRGGHVVRMAPQPNMVPQEMSEILRPGGDSLVISGAGAPVLVLGFAETRAARITGIDWIEAAPPGYPAEPWPEISAAASETPLGPWRDLGRLTTAADGGRSLRLPEPARARFLRLAPTEAFASPSVQGWLFPTEIRVTEAPGSAAAPSVTGEWGMSAPLAADDLTGTPPSPASDDAEDQDSPAAPRPLGWGETVTARVVLGQDQDHWSFTPPPGEERALITLTGDPVVLTALEAFGPDGTSLPLRRLPPEPGRQRHELAVTPGQSYRLQVSEPPRSIVVAVDVSGSLAPFWETIRQGLGAFAEGPVPGRDFLRFLPFDGQFDTTDWTDQPDVLRRGLGALTALTTGSGLEPTTRTALRALIERDGLRALVLLTDGATSGFPEREAMWTELERSGVQVFAGHIGGWDDPGAEKRLMQDVAAVGGGFYAHLQTQAEIDVMMERTIDWLRRPARYGLVVARSDLPPPEPARLSVLIPDAAAAAPAPDPGGSTPDDTPRVSAARPSVGLIIDASGSMLQSMPQGGRRIDVAHRVLDDLIRNRIPPGTPVALRAFGDTAEGSCETALRAPLMPVVPDYLAPMATAITPVNLAKTPIAASLAAMAGDLAAATGPRVVVLVTDGEETCGGDPEAEIARLRAAGLSVTVNIVGFALDDSALAETFAEWAALGGGRYFPAADEAGLAAALSAATSEGFTVLGAAGQVIATGIVGGAPVEVPAGRWRVVVGEGRAEFEAVDLVEGEARALQLPAN